MTADEIIKEAEHAETEAEASAKAHDAAAKEAAKKKDTSKEDDEKALASGARERAAAAKKAKELGIESKNAPNAAAAASSLALAQTELDKAKIRDRIVAAFKGETNKDLDEKVLELADGYRAWLGNNPGKNFKDWPNTACRTKAGSNLGKLGISTFQNPNPDKEKEMADFLRQLVQIEGAFK